MKIYPGRDDQVFSPFISPPGGVAWILSTNRRWAPPPPAFVLPDGFFGLVPSAGGRAPTPAVNRHTGPFVPRRGRSRGSRVNVDRGLLRSFLGSHRIRSARPGIAPRLSARGKPPTRSIETFPSTISGYSRRKVSPARPFGLGRDDGKALVQFSAIN